jgi:uncharacterized protein YqgC (DUF456 family)
MPGSGKSDIKLGFYVGIGLLLAFLAGSIAQAVLMRARRSGGG